MLRRQHALGGDACAQAEIQAIVGGAQRWTWVPSCGRPSATISVLLVVCSKELKMLVTVPFEAWPWRAASSCGKQRGCAKREE